LAHEWEDEEIDSASASFGFGNIAKRLKPCFFQATSSMAYIKIADPQSRTGYLLQQSSSTYEDYLNYYFIHFYS
jgi:hypothetical protein